MLSNIFEALDGIARFVGWAAMIGGVLWLIERHNKEKATFDAAQADQKARFEFEDALRKGNPDRYRRYRHIKEGYQLRGETAHWQQIANEAGVTPLDIRDGS